MRSAEGCANMTNVLTTLRRGETSPRGSVVSTYGECANMNEFVRVCQASDVPDPGKRLVEVGERYVVLFHVGGQFYALDDVCTHDGGPLGEGFLEGFTIACPRHGAKFDIRDGRVLCMPAVSGTNSHEVKVEDGEVFVKFVDRPKKNYVM